MANRRSTGGPESRIEAGVSESTANRKLPRGYDYFIVIRGTEGFSAVFNGSGEPKSALIRAVFSSAFQERLKTVSLQLADSLVVEVYGVKMGTGLGDLDNFRIHHEGPYLTLAHVVYDEGWLLRQLRKVS